MKLKRIIRAGTGLVIVGAVAAVTVPAGAASGISAQTIMKGRGDSGDHGNYWATDSFPRDLSVISHGAAPAANCGGHSGCTAYTASVADGSPFGPGTFTTIAGQDAPNQSGAHAGQVVTRKVGGTFSGFIDYGTFYATANPAASNVPPVYTGNGISSSDWPTLAFPAGTVLYSLTITDFGYNYTTTTPNPDQHWTDSLTADTGQITG